MFEKSGEKIKKVSRTIFVLNVVIVCAVGVFWIVQSNGLFFMTVLIAAVLIIVCSWVSLLVLYAFGDLVDSNEHILELLQRKENNPLVELLKLYQDGILTKEEFDKQKHIWINRGLNNVLEIIDIKKAYENGLLLKEEYDEIKKDLFNKLNQQNAIAIYRVIFEDARINFERSLKIEAPQNATKEELVKIVRKMGYDDEIDDIIKKS